MSSPYTQQAVCLYVHESGTGAARKQCSLKPIGTSWKLCMWMNLHPGTRGHWMTGVAVQGPQMYRGHCHGMEQRSGMCRFGRPPLLPLLAPSRLVFTESKPMVRAIWRSKRIHLCDAARCEPDPAIWWAMHLAADSGTVHSSTFRPGHGFGSVTVHARLCGLWSHYGSVCFLWHFKVPLKIEKVPLKCDRSCILRPIPGRSTREVLYPALCGTESLPPRSGLRMGRVNSVRTLLFIFFV
jgi:hypothetical protein